MEELAGTRTDPTRTQPLPAVRRRRQGGETRSFRLVRTAVFGVALLIGIATAVVLLGGDETTLRNPSNLYSPSGHLPGEPNSEQSVSMSWTGVEGAAGYWWAMVEDRSRLPQPRIRPSGDDRRVYFRFSGSAFFVLRTAFRTGGDLRWTDALAYGPIVVRDGAPAPPGPSPSPGVVGDESGEDAAEGSSGSGTRGGTAFGGSAPDPEPVDPRFAGQPGECPPGADPSQCGGAGEPGQPAQEPGGGQRPSNDDGIPGQDGPDGGQGPD